jgi:anti-sigma factor RsiW
VTTVFKSGQELDPLSQTTAQGAGDCSGFAQVSPGVMPFRRVAGTRLPEVDEADLHAYVDGQLEPERRFLVEAVLARNLLQRRRAEAFRAINTNLQDLLGGDLPPMSADLSRFSADLERRIAQISRRSRRRDLVSRIRTLVASALAALLRWNTSELDQQTRPLR